MKNIIFFLFSFFLLGCKAESAAENNAINALNTEAKQELSADEMGRSLKNALNTEAKQELSADEMGRSLKKMQYIEKLADRSTKLHKYCWSNVEELGGCFIASSMMIVGYNGSQNLLAYFHKVAAQAENSGIVYRLKVQDMTTNKILLDKKFSYTIDSEGYEKSYEKLNNIEIAYQMNGSEIQKVLEKFLMRPAEFSFEYLPYVKETAKINIGFSVTKASIAFGVNPPEDVTTLKNLVIKQGNKLFFKQNYSGGSFCPDCIYPFFLLEPLVQINLPSNQKVLVLGLLAYDVLSPNTLFFQLIGIP